MGRYRGDRGGFPTALAFLIAVALVFGAFYLFRGVQGFFLTGGLGVDESTRQAGASASATAARVTRMPQAGVRVTLRPTATPPPSCQDFRVNVRAGIVRETPGSGGAIVTQLNEGTIVCVLARDPGSEWYTLDLNPNTRRIDLAYMHETVIESVNPTPTATLTQPATRTFTPAPPTPTADAPSATELPDFLPSMPPALATVTRTPGG
ncbi:MAG: SH3 domain-containing protein [Chloroflexota bacterium]|nr:SH3 domain-containing protein [Chloroflexota bacterium]